MKGFGRKELIWYSAAFALLMVFLKAIEYRLLVKSFSVDIYLGAIALMFTTLGIWIAYQILPPPVLKRKILIKPGDTPSSSLSARELEVLVKIADGHSNQEIADSLFISIHTVKTHSSSIFEKLNVKRRTEAVLRAKELGILEEELS